jgi:plasmid replication initiation protein
MEKSDLVVKSNELIKASYTLGLVEQRLILMAIVQARETGEGITESTLLTIRAQDYAALFGVTKQAAYMAMSEAVETLFNRRVTVYQFIDDIYEQITVRWVTAMSHKPKTGVVRLRFGIEVVPEITRLEENFTSYELEQVAGLNSAYAVRLYELLIQWRTAGKTPLFEIEKFREQLGVNKDEYQRMELFKRRVLDLSVAQINEFTDIVVTYEQIKEGTKIVGFLFKFKQKSKPIEPPQKLKKSEPPKAATSFAGLQLVLLNQIQKSHPEITEKYVRDYAEQSGLDIVQVLEKIKLDYKAAEEFSLEKTD